MLLTGASGIHRAPTSHFVPISDAAVSPTVQPQDSNALTGRLDAAAVISDQESYAKIQWCSGPAVALETALNSTKELNLFGKAFPELIILVPSVCPSFLSMHLLYKCDT
jgi:hypothetical protein